MNKSAAFATAAVVATLGLQTQAGLIIFSDDFEPPASPDVTDAQSLGNTSGAVSPNFVRATQGFGAGRSGLVDETSGHFTDPTGTQAYAFRYTNSGLTSKQGVIGALTLGETYTVSFDVVRDDGRNAGLPYDADLFAWNPGARRDDARSDTFGTILAGAAGDASNDGLYTTITFDFFADPTLYAALAGRDLTIRFKGATTSATIDNVQVEVVPEPASVALLALGGLLIARRRRAS